MFELKPLTRESIPRALEKAERYRLLNEPAEAESICRDVLGVEPDNQQALVTLLLACTELFDEELPENVREAERAVGKLSDEYARVYYGGIVFERKAKTQLKRGTAGMGHAAYESLRRAMSLYEKAEAIRPPGNDDALLRWNTCVRLLERHPHLTPAPRESTELPLE
jgi:hypothetical protein